MQITERDVIDLNRARGEVAAAQFNLEQTLGRIYESQGVDPKTIVRFDGDIITVQEDPDA